MGCNAWNHPPGCNCGWGGIHYDSGLVSNRNYWWILESYTVPNAVCSVCGTKVFFYKSPFGGRVYFDELGPPWPKHGCTRQDFNGNDISSRYVKRNPLHQCKDSGWVPLLCSSIRHDDEFIEIVVKNPEKVIPKVLYVKSKRLISTKDSPIFIRKIELENVYEVSALDVWGREPSEIKLIAARSIDELNKILGRAGLGKGANALMARDIADGENSSVELMDIDEFDEDDISGVVDLRPKIDHPFSTNQEFSDFLYRKLVDMMVVEGGAFYPGSEKYVNSFIFLAPISFLARCLTDGSGLDPLDPNAATIVLTGRCLNLFRRQSLTRSCGINH